MSLKSLKSLKLFVFSLVVILMTLTGCANSSESNENNKNNEVSEVSENTENNESNENSESNENNESNENSESNGNTENNAIQETTATKQEMPLEISQTIPNTRIIEGDKLTDAEITDFLKSHFEAMTNYCETYGKYAQFVSRGGFFYEYTNKFYITFIDLFDLELLEIDLAHPNVVNLYVFPSHIENISGITSNQENQEDNLTIYTAYAAEEGIHIFGENLSGVISASDYEKLLSNYNFYNGEITQIKKHTDDHKDLISLIQTENNNTAEYDVRYLYRDDKYAVGVFSSVDNPSDIEQYVFINNNSWEIAIANYENFPNFAQDINSILYDLNLELIQECNINKFTGYINVTAADAVVSGMIASNAVNDDDGELVFSSSTNDFMFLEFESGKTFIGSSYMNNGVWTVYPTTDYEQSILVLKNLHLTPPLFIVRQY